MEETPGTTPTWNTGLSTAAQPCILLPTDPRQVRLCSPSTPITVIRPHTLLHAPRHPANTHCAAREDKSSPSSSSFDFLHLEITTGRAATVGPGGDTHFITIMNFYQLRPFSLSYLSEHLRRSRVKCATKSARQPFSVPAIFLIIRTLPSYEGG